MVQQYPAYQSSCILPSAFSGLRIIRGPLPPPHPHHFCKNYRDLKLGISHLMIPLMEALGVSSLGKIGFRSYGYLKTTDFYT